MVDSGRATKEEADFIAVMKDRRDQFADEDIEQIKTYTTLELRLLARMMSDLRTGFEQIGLRLRHWHGAGAAASALIESRKLKMHYGPDIAAANISPQQTAAHHAYYGGRIELLKQGYVENRALHVYDIASAYPAAMVEFPSLAGGRWMNEARTLRFRTGSLSELRAAVEAASIVSMFKIQFQFPTYERYRHRRPQGRFHSLLPIALSRQARRHPVPRERLWLVHAGRCPGGDSLAGALRPRLSAAAEEASTNDGVRDRRGLDF